MIAFCDSSSISVVTCQRHCKLSVSSFPGSLFFFFAICCTAGDGDLQFSCPRDLDLIQSIPAAVELLDMKAPPRVLTLSEQPLDSLETRQMSKSNPSSHSVSQI